MTDGPREEEDLSARASTPGPIRTRARPRPRGGGLTLGDVRRIDRGSTPDRHPSAVRWPDDRRPRAVPVEGAATPVAEALRRRLHGPIEEAGASAHVAEAGASRRATAVRPRGDGPFVEWLDDDEHPGDDEHVDRAAPSVSPLEERRGRGSVVKAEPDERTEVGSARRPGRRRRPRRDSVEANARLTGSTAAVLFVLLAVEGVTILQIRPLLNVHVFVGMLLIPPVLLKIGSTTWRFAKYYLGDPEYRRKGPPHPFLRLLGPVVVVLTLVVLASGVALLLVPSGSRSFLLLLHKASFVIWLMVMAVHVLGHLADTARLAPRDWYRRTRREIKGAGLRRWLVAMAVALGLVVGAAMLPQVGPWLAGAGRG